MEEKEKKEKWRKGGKMEKKRKYWENEQKVEKG